MAAARGLAGFRIAVTVAVSRFFVGYSFGRHESGGGVARSVKKVALEQ